MSDPFRFDIPAVHRWLMDARHEKGIKAPLQVYTLRRLQRV